MTQRREISTVAEFFAHALAVEQEAAVRYRELADQMRAHHNLWCARVFDRLATLEEGHAANLRNKVKRMDLPRLAPWAYRWIEPEAPESTPFDRAHYLMTGHHALTLALANERRAKDFFEHAAAHSADPEVRALAHEFALEEQEHVDMIGSMLHRESEPGPDWAQDFDGPVEPE